MLHSSGARSAVQVGLPIWSQTTRSSSRLSARRSMVPTKFFPLTPNTQEMRTIKCAASASRTALSPASLLAPYTFRGPVGSSAS